MTQVSFATVVLGLSRRGDAPAGRKAIKLYESMRRDFKFMPDEVIWCNVWREFWPESSAASEN